jgi:hypothetical protein
LFRFDPVLLANKDKTWIVPARHYKKVWRIAAIVEGVILGEDGMAWATWKYEKKGTKELLVHVYPFETQKPASKGKKKTTGRKSEEAGLAVGLTPHVKKEVERISEDIATFFGRSLSAPPVYH